MKGYTDIWICDSLINTHIPKIPHQKPIPSLPISTMFFPIAISREPIERTDNGDPICVLKWWRSLGQRRGVRWKLEQEGE